MALININSHSNILDLFTRTASKYIMISEANFHDTFPHALQLSFKTFQKLSIDINFPDDKSWSIFHLM